MKKTDFHTGFHENGPAAEYFSEQSYIEPVPAEERFDIVKLLPYEEMFFLGLFFAGLILLCLPSLIDNFFRNFPFEHSPAQILYYTLAGSVLLISVLHTFLRNQLVRWRIFSRVKKRKGRLFVPDKNCHAVIIEDALSVHINKSAPEDCGILRISEDAVELEMQEYRARFSTQDIEVSPVQLSEQNQGVSLSCFVGEHIWSVVLYTTSLSKRKKIAQKWIGLFRDAQVHISHGKNDENDSIALEQDVCDFSAWKNTGKPLRDVNVNELIQNQNAKLTRAKIKNLPFLYRNKYDLLILAVVCLIFLYSVGLFRWGLSILPWLAVVWLVHESVFWLSAKLLEAGRPLFQLFPVPLTVIEDSFSIKSWKRAAILLSSPIVGILVGIILLMLHRSTGQNTYFLAGSVFLFLNMLFLVPVYPFEGSKLMGAILCPRHRYWLMIIPILGLAFLIPFSFGVQFLSGNILFVIVLNLILTSYTLTSTVVKFQKEIQQDLQSEIFFDEKREIPKKVFDEIINKAGENFPYMHARVRWISSYLDQLRLKPPGFLLTSSFLLVYFASFYLAFTSLGRAGIGLFGFYEKWHFESYTKEDGGVGQKGIQFEYFWRTGREAELTDDRSVFHGDTRWYHRDGSVMMEGCWDRGKRTGFWNVYEDKDEDNRFYGTAFYEDGIPRYKKDSIKGEMVETPWEDFPLKRKKLHIYASTIQQGPGNEINYALGYMDYMAVDPELFAKLNAEIQRDPNEM